MRVFSLVPILVLLGFAAALPTEQARELNVKELNLARRGSASEQSTCIVAPDTTREDYVANPLIRQDVRDGQTGVPLLLQITVIDVTTCKPLPNVLVEVWSPNALGSYGQTFLRGAFTSSSSGVAEFQTIFPGHTSDGANHINLMVHTTSSTSGTVAHNGQVFFTDRWTDIIGATATYSGNTNTRMLNSQDPNYQTANSGGFNAVVDIESIGDDWADAEGVIGYITIGVNPANRVSF